MLFSALMDVLQGENARRLSSVVPSSSVVRRPSSVVDYAFAIIIYRVFRHSCFSHARRNISGMRNSSAIVCVLFCVCVCFLSVCVLYCQGNRQIAYLVHASEIIFDRSSVFAELRSPFVVGRLSSVVCRVVCRRLSLVVCCFMHAHSRLRFDFKAH